MKVWILGRCEDAKSNRISDYERCDFESREGLALSSNHELSQFSELLDSVWREDPYCQSRGDTPPPLIFFQDQKMTVYFAQKAMFQEQRMFCHSWNPACWYYISVISHLSSYLDVCASNPSLARTSIEGLLYPYFRTQRLILSIRTKKTSFSLTMRRFFNYSKFMFSILISHLSSYLHACASNLSFPHRSRGFLSILPNKVPEHLPLV